MKILRFLWRHKIGAVLGGLYAIPGISLYICMLSEGNAREWCQITHKIGFMTVSSIEPLPLLLWIFMLSGILAMIMGGVMSYLFYLLSFLPTSGQVMVLWAIVVLQVFIFMFLAAGVEFLIRKLFHKGRKNMQDTKYETQDTNQ